MPLQKERLQKFQLFLTNSIDWEKVQGKHLVALIGDSPSKYAKSPVVWNAGFEALGIDAIFLPFDVQEENLKGLLEAMREEQRLLGFSVTVPYKIKVIPLLDEVDAKVEAIGAVNTVVRTAGGRLTGYNTDGQGGMESLLKLPAGTASPFLGTLKGLNVLLIGAGGAARSLGFHLVERLQGGRLFLANRAVEKAERLSADLKIWNAKTEPLPEKEISKVAKSVDLIINASTKGQQGLRYLSDGALTCLEPYSALAPASPPTLPSGSEENFFSRWTPGALKDIEENNERSFEILLEIPSRTALFDIIYAPLETIFLRQGRWTGHRIQNGKMMNIAQALDAFYHKVVNSFLQEKGLYTPDTYQRLLQAMTAKW